MHPKRAALSLTGSRSGGNKEGFQLMHLLWVRFGVKQAIYYNITDTKVTSWPIKVQSWTELSISSPHLNKSGIEGRLVTCQNNFFSLYLYSLCKTKDFHFNYYRVCQCNCNKKKLEYHKKLDIVDQIVEKPNSNLIYTHYIKRSRFKTIFWKCLLWITIKK